MAKLLFIKKGSFPRSAFETLLHQNISLPANALASERAQFDHICFDVTIPNFLSRTELTEIRRKFGAHQIDVICMDQYLDPDVLSLFCFDMDSTVIREEVIDELARKHGVFEEVSRVTREAMEGGMAFDEALKLRVKYLKGLSRKSFEEVYDLLTLSAGMEIILRELPKLNTKVSILSGGFTPVLELFSRKYPIHFFKANELEENGGIFTGKIVGEIINKEKKSYYLDQLITRETILKSQVVAVGDGANDALMLNTANIGIGFHAKQGLKDQISNWIDFCDMSVLLFLFRPSI
ncbi:phosphoserine phosphatase SerB [Leptospira ognonensis]|nr:phosphoserine phosphatase SerB [Leptospira ognonensis]